MSPTALLRTFGLLLAATTARLSAAEPPFAITVHADRTTGELRPIWNGFGYDEALTTLTPEGRHLLGELNAMTDAPVQIRVHHLLTSGDGSLGLKWSSTNVYTEDAQGKPVYDWTRMDAIMDELARPGMQPFVQASFMPQALSSQPTPYTPPLVKVGRPGNMLAGGAFVPPKDYQKWQDLIEAWARHSGQRYGVERASSWLWELWNEPESAYFRGTKEDYFKLYDHFVAGVKRALPNARVGGPHTTDPRWRKGDEFMAAFLEHCRSGTNAVTGRRGTALDFVAFHAKGSTRLDAQGRVEMNLRDHLGTIDTYAALIARFPEFARLPIYIGESDPEGCAGCSATEYPERGYRLTSQFAAYTAASFMRKQDLVAQHGGNLQLAITWAFTFADQPWFNGLRALTTNQVALPVFNTFKLFSRLGPTRLALTAPAMFPTDAILSKGVREGADIGAIASRHSDRLTILLWNYHDVAGAVTQSTEIALTIAGEARSAASIHEYAVDEISGNSHTKWRALGAPASPSPQQIQALVAAAEMRPIARNPTSSTNGALTLSVSMPPQSVKLIEINLGARR